MTWKEFKDLVEMAGVKNADLIMYVDWSSDRGEDDLVVARSLGGEITIVNTYAHPRLQTEKR